MREKVEMNEQPKSALIIQFAGPGSTDFVVSMEGIVTVGQLEALAHNLLAQAQYTRWAQIHQVALEQQQAEGDKEPKIAVPGMHPAQVADILRGVKE
jgi:hypothetical protein